MRIFIFPWPAVLSQLSLFSVAHPADLGTITGRDGNAVGQQERMNTGASIAHVNTQVHNTFWFTTPGIFKRKNDLCCYKRTCRLSSSSLFRKKTGCFYSSVPANRYFTAKMWYCADFASKVESQHDKGGLIITLNALRGTKLYQLSN